MPALTKITTCLWVRTTDAGAGTLLSYATAYEADEFAVRYNSNVLRVVTSRKKRQVFQFFRLILGV